MKNIFSQTKIAFNDMLNDTLQYLSKKYEQSRNLFTPASPWGQIIYVLHEIAQLIFFYIEDSITELNIYSASRPQSIYGLAALAGHNPRRASAANGDILIKYNGTPLDGRGNQIIIPNYTKLRCAINNLVYVIQLHKEDIRISTSSASTPIVVKIMQGEIEEQTFTGTGLPLQSFEATVKLGSQIDQYNVKVYVNGTSFKLYESFYDVPKDALGVVVRTGITSGIDIVFGNEFNGYIPPQGSEIVIQYLKTQGESGNVRSGLNTTWSFDDVGYDILGNEINLNTYLDVSLQSQLIFGSNPEPTYLTRELAFHNSSRTNILANPDGYIYFLEKLNYFSVVDAFTTFDDDFVDDDNVIYLFLIPDINKRMNDDETYFTVSTDLFVLSQNERTRLIDMIYDSGSMIVTTVIQIVEPIIKRYVLNISLTTFENYSKEIIKEDIISILSEYFLSLRRRDIIPKSDIYSLIESVTGVDSINILFVSEENESYWATSPTESKIYGLNDFGDIVIGKNELAILRGGWSNRNGVYYHDTVDTGNDPNILGSVNIEFKEIVPKTLNSTLNKQNIAKIKKI